VRRRQAVQRRQTAAIGFATRRRAYFLTGNAGEEAMTTNIRFSTASDDIPLFTEGGFQIARGTWFAIDLDAATPEQRDLLEKYLGRIVQVHEYDETRFLEASAPLELCEGKLRYPLGTDLKTVASIGERHQVDAKVNAAEKARAAELAAQASTDAAATDGGDALRGIVGKKGAKQS
jgi:hypothetical protein